MTTRPRPRLTAKRRALRYVLGLALLAPAALHAGSCAAPFDPQSLVNSVRVFSVDIDKPYANPGDEVTFRVHYVDARDTGGEFTPIQITWLAGCWNPEGGQYYSCYEPLGELLAQVQSGAIPPDGLVAQGPGLDAFTVTIPDDLVSSVPEPALGPRAGVGIIFFTVCAGRVGVVEPEGETAARGFPLGCFDEDGNNLGPEAFIPGYTQVYAFEDERQNANPAVGGLAWNGDTQEEGTVLEAKTCGISVDDRRKSGCAAQDEFTECDAVEIDVDVESDVAELDPDGTTVEGEPLNEVVWVSYFSDAGSFESDLKLVSDASKGITDDHGTEWVPPPEPGLYTVWAVVRDNRGGSTTLQHLVEVE